MIEWILTSSVLILVVALLRRVLSGRISLRLRYALWALVLVRLLIPFSLTGSAISVTSIAGEGIRDIETMVQTPIRSSEYDAAIREVTAQFLTQQIDLDTLSREELDQAIRQNVYDQVMAEHDRDSAHPPISEHEVNAQVESRMSAMYSIDPGKVLTALWLVGVALMCTAFLWSNARLALNLRKTRKALEIDYTLPVYVTDYVATPCLFGLVHSAIYLPREAADSPHLDHILAHETTHHRQGDPIWSLLRCAALALHWYNPLVWFAAAASKKDAELACDEATIARLGESQRTAYGETLITMTCARRDRKDLFITATTMNTGKRTLKERVTMIAKHPKTAVYTLIAVILVMALAVGCTFTGPGNESTPPDVTTEPPTTTAPTEDPPEVPESNISSFPEGEIQAILLYVNGNLYARSETETESELPESCTLAGIVETVNDRKEPAEDFQAAHLPMGTEVYTVSDTTSHIFVKDSTTELYCRMWRADISGDWWSKTFKVNPISGFEPEGELMSSGFMHSVQRKFNTWETMYLQAVTCLYDSPQELDLGQFFYNGIPGVDNTLTPEEATYLKSINAYADVDVSRLPEQQIDAILTGSFGITLSEANTATMSDLPYWEETGCYYLFHGDTNLQSVTVHSAYTHGEFIDIYYCTHSGTPTPDYVLTIRSVGGDVWFVSNKMAEIRPEYNGFIPEGKRMSEEAAAGIAALFEDCQSWYSMATASIFSTPEEAELNILFYNGIPGEETVLTNKEKEYLRNTWLGSEIGNLEFTRVSADDMDAVLEEYFGISLEDSAKRGTWDFVYWDDTDCYYEAHNDAIAQDINVLSVYIRTAGMVDVYYTLDGGTGTEYYVMTLRLRDDQFFIYANKYVNSRTTLTTDSSKDGIYFPYDAAISSVVPLSEEELAYFNALFQPFDSSGNANLVSSFFNAFYASPEELDLTEFLRYNSLSREITSGDDFDIICQREGFTDFVPVPIHK